MVRPAGSDDWQTWRMLRLRALADAPDAFGQDLAEVRARPEADWKASVAPRPDSIRLLAEREGTAVGMMVVTIDAYDQRRADVYAMWVAPEARSAGIGRALIDTGLAWARRHGALDVYLRVSERQAAARRLYIRAGFAPTGADQPLRPGSDIRSHELRARLLPLVMGVVNVTPDSFSDGGVYLDPAAAIRHGEDLADAGADILDIGGEATNPRARPVSAAEELTRVLPVIEGLAGLAGRGITLSIDTTKAEVARLALDAGASIINDVSGGLFDTGMPSVLAAAGAHGDVTYIAGHLRGQSLAEVFATEGGVGWEEVAAELSDRLLRLPVTARVWVDPGIGFGKGADPEGNVALLRHAGDISETVRRPIVVGASRKRFLRRLLGLGSGPTSPEDQARALDAASTLASLAAVRAGAHIIRVHNVTLLRRALTAYNRE